jgi:hypothetical protein
MATSLNPWSAILRSIEKRRSYDARFYKPVCLIAAVDAALNGEFVAPIVSASAVIQRFRSYVSQLYPERADLGWRPFWHLSNDGVWHFTKEGRKVRPADFGVARKPDSRGQLLSRIDQVAIPDDMVPLWRSSESLSLLREALVEMLKQDEATCRSMAAVLSDRPQAHYFLEPQDDAPANRPAKGTRGQGFQVLTEARLAVERQAMAIAIDVLKAEGWEVHDVSASESFDILCLRGDTRRFAEVKGTIGAGEQIILTANEVAFATAHQANMILVVVAGIELQRDHAGRIVASKGGPTLYRSWAPVAADLAPIAYTYALNARRKARTVAVADHGSRRMNRTAAVP